MNKLWFLIPILGISGCSSSIAPHVQCAGAKVQIGMTSQIVLNLCGKPDSINVTELLDDKSEQWVYSSSIHDRDYVYITNGIVNSIQY